MLMPAPATRQSLSSLEQVYRYAALAQLDRGAHARYPATDNQCPLDQLHISRSGSSMRDSEQLERVTAQQRAALRLRQRGQGGNQFVRRVVAHVEWIVGADYDLADADAIDQMAKGHAVVDHRVEPNLLKVFVRCLGATRGLRPTLKA